MSNISVPSSEISIRITTNPNPVEDIEAINEKEKSSYPQIASRTTSKPNHCIPSIACTQPPIPARKTKHLKSRHTTGHSKPPPVPPHRSPRNLNEIKRLSGEGQAPPVPPHRHIGPTKRLSNPQIMSQTVTRSKNPDWNKSNDKLDYNHLMEYFDGLKESNA